MAPQSSGRMGTIDVRDGRGRDQTAKLIWEHRGGGHRRREHRGPRTFTIGASEDDLRVRSTATGGEVHDAAKADFLGNAAALLFPIDWIEAMACGTPVLAWRRGSIPEIVDRGVTGFIVENETEAVQAVGALDRLDRRNIRRVFEQRFTARRMAQEYMHCFERLGCQS